MSNIPQARVHLKLALDAHPTEAGYRSAIKTALALMDRQKPKFVAKRTHKALTLAQKEAARSLRDRGWSMQDISKLMGVQVGRVSEACGAS